MAAVVITIAILVVIMTMIGVGGVMLDKLGDTPLLLLLTLLPALLFACECRRDFDER